MLEWEKLRDENSTEPAISVEGFDTAAEALASAEDDELLIIDAPAHATRGTLEIAQAATLIVQPTGQASTICGPRSCSFTSWCRPASQGAPGDGALSHSVATPKKTWRAATSKTAGYDVLPGCIPERTAYREAQNRGQAVTETKHKALNERVDELMEGLYTRVAEQLEARQKRSQIAARKRKNAS